MFITDFFKNIFTYMANSLGISVGIVIFFSIFTICFVTVMVILFIKILKKLSKMGISEKEAVESSSKNSKREKK